jgi:hypothetical protein
MHQHNIETGVNGVEPVGAEGRLRRAVYLRKANSLRISDFLEP